MRKIAVFKDDTGKMTNFYGCSSFTVYEETESGIEEVCSQNFQAVEPSSPALIRQQTMKIQESVPECRIAAFGEISGIPYSAFDMAGYQIFQIQDAEEETIKGIFADIRELEQANEAAKEQLKQAVPVETASPGVFFLDLLKIQNEHPEISSKKILLPFFEQTPFMELKLICGHVPPWLLRDERFAIQSEQTDQGFTALITHQQC